MYYKKLKKGLVHILISLSLLELLLKISEVAGTSFCCIWSWKVRGWVLESLCFLIKHFLANEFQLFKICGYCQVTRERSFKCSNQSDCCIFVLLLLVESYFVWYKWATKFCKGNISWSWLWNLKFDFCWIVDINHNIWGLMYWGHRWTSLLVCFL